VRLSRMRRISADYAAQYARLFSDVSGMSWARPPPSARRAALVRVSLRRCDALTDEQEQPSHKVRLAALGPNACPGTTPPAAVCPHRAELDLTAN